MQGHKWLFVTTVSQQVIPYLQYLPIPSPMNGMCNHPPWRHHYHVLAFSEDLSSLGSCLKPNRQKGESTYKPLWRETVFTPFTLNPQSNIYECYTYENRQPYTPQKYIMPLLLAGTQLAPAAALSKISQQPLVVAMKYDQTGVIFHIYLFNFETEFLEKPMNSSPTQRVSDCKAAGFSLLVEICKLLSTKVKVETFWERAFYRKAIREPKSLTILLRLAEIFCKRRQVGTCKAPRLLKWSGEM